MKFGQHNSTNLWITVSLSFREYLEEYNSWDLEVEHSVSSFLRRLYHWM